MRQMQQQLRQIQSTLSQSQQAKSDLPPYVSPLEQFAGAGQERLPRGLPPCTVPIFKRGGEIPIDMFFFTLEVYFAATYIPDNFLVPIAMSRFDASHHIELQPLIELTLRGVPYSSTTDVQRSRSVGSLYVVFIQRVSI